MIINYTTTIIIFISLHISILLSAQHHNIRQWQANYSFTNPALTGIAINPRISASYQQIFPAVQTGLNTYKLDYDQQISANAGFIGASLLQDLTSEVMTRKVAGMQYAYEFKLNDDIMLRTGVSLAYVYLDIDSSKFRSSTRENADDKQGGHYGGGAMLTYKNVYAGFALHNFSQSLAPANSLGKKALISDYSTQLGGFFHLQKRNPKSLVLAPYLLVYGKPKLVGLAPGINVNKGILTGGLSYRSYNYGDALSFLAGVSKGWFKAGYTYDISIPNARSVWAASHELTFTVYPGRLRDGTDAGLPNYFRKMGF